MAREGIQTLNLLRLRNTLVAPTTPTEGDIRFTDASGWDPGQGEGYYEYDGSTWNYLGLALGNSGYGWKDMTSSISSAKVPPASAPTATNFGSAGSLQRQEFAFAVGDYVWLEPFHVNHDIKPNSLAHMHVHWTTNGTSTATVKWELSYQRALGHNQAAFGAPTAITVTQAASGTAYQHMVAEDTTGITMYEPDELILVSLRRVTNGGTDNADTVFGLTVDFHYQADRSATKNKAPNFYA